jgi:non-homologous end joining protein Ku
VLQPQTEEPAQVVDLMAALEASLAAVKDAKPAKKKK